MPSLWRSLFGAPDQPAERTTDAVRKIAEALDQLPPDQARYIAAYAYILGRVAKADHAISPEETATMERMVMEVGGLPEDQAVLVVQIAKTRNQLFGATEDFLVTREFNELATREQKLQLLEALFAVSAAADDIALAEDNEIRKIAAELVLEHRDVIAVRLGFRDKLKVLKRPGAL
ncbi:MAG: TerB family tellurite resistance protein [Bryobacteraceae bacterium]|nr:TerB family tellurite resistance protein [Bryobacteraceae bacterium]